MKLTLVIFVSLISFNVYSAEHKKTLNAGEIFDSFAKKFNFENKNERNNFEKATEDAILTLESTSGLDFKIKYRQLIDSIATLSFSQRVIKLREYFINLSKQIVFIPGRMEKIIIF